MLPFLSYTVVLHLLVFKVGSIFAQEQKYAMSKQEAEDECSRTGRTLVNYKELQSNPTASEYLRQLENGEMAWIYGYAELSPFFQWEGCHTLSGQHVEHEYQMIDISLFICLKKCSSHGDVETIGIKGKTCYCLHNLISHLPVDAALCNISCSDNVIDSCGGNSYVDVYRLINLDWESHEPPKRQCIYFKKRQHELEAYATSCHALTATGYVCVNNDWFSDRLENTTCYKTFRIGPLKFCMKKTHVTRQEASEDCLSINGRLMLYDFHYIFLNDLKEELPNSIRYWLAPYRTFEMVDEITSNETACLAAIKVNNALHLEPDDCSQKKHALCRQERVLSTVPKHFTSPAMETVPNHIFRISMENVLNHSSNISMVNRSTNISRVSMETYFIGYIALSMSTLGVLITVGFTVFVYRQLKWLKKRIPSPRDPRRAHRIGIGDRDFVSQNANETDGHSVGPGDLPSINEGCRIAASLHLYEGLQDSKQQNTYEVLV